jgi:hypothetical protein
MAEWFAKVRCRKDEPVFERANMFLKAIEQHLPSKSASIYYASILATVTRENFDALVILLACSL